MKKQVLLLGSSGMLGWMLLDVLSQDSSLSLFATVRNKAHKRELSKKFPTVKFMLFDVEKDDITKLLAYVKRVRYIVNAIGIIKPFIHDTNKEEIRKALLVNSLFPYQLEKAIAKKQITVVQIATDCVYSGKKGGSTEETLHDPHDVYGKTKSLGEVPSQQFYHLRCSVVGPENGTKKSLHEWFLGQEKGAVLSGFTNHIWSGITTLHFAKLTSAIIQHDLQLPTFLHIVPADRVHKGRLLRVFAKHFGRNDITIQNSMAKQAVDRSLATLHDTINMKLWKAAGYKRVPTIAEMVEELAEYMKAIGNRQ